MRVLVADKFEQSGRAGLAASGCEVAYEPELQEQSLVEALDRLNPEILVVRSTKVTAAMLDHPSLALVVRAGAGVNTIDVAAASARGIHVANCPGKNAVAVAELTLGLLLALDRRIPDNVADLRAGRWNKKEYSHADGLFGRTLGVLGLGAIACEVIRRAHAFGLGIVAWSRRYHGQDRALSLDEARRLGLEAVHLEAPIRLAPTPAEVASRVDALSVHLALGSGTRGLVGAEVLERLRPDAFFINTARGEIVDAAALERIAREKPLRVGLDVFAQEPAGGTGDFADPITALPRVYGTHHIGASTEQAQESIAAETVRIVRSFVESGRVPNCVNLARRSEASHRLVVRHHDQPGVLAHVFERLRDAGINVQETENILFEGGDAALARIHLDRAPDEPVLAAIRSGHAAIIDARLVKI